MSQNDIKSCVHRRSLSTEIILYRVYQRGTLGIGCIRFKHGRVRSTGIRWHTARQNIFFKYAQKFCAYIGRMLYIIAYSRHTLNTLEVRQKYGYSYAGISKDFCAYENYFINFHTLLIRSLLIV